MELIFATNNQNKINELQALLPKKIKIKSLAELHLDHIKLEETGDTFQENALQKAKAIYLQKGIPTFAEDSGLVVNSLGGAPGIYSARYAGEDGNDEANNKKLLESLEGVEDRSAYFIAVIALYDGEDVQYFEGRINGQIALAPKGESGFGYDPLFIPTGYENTFAELGFAEKNKISHRALALKKFCDFMERLR